MAVLVLLAARTSSGAAPQNKSCAAGELLFAVSNQPLDIQLTADGRSLLVVDSGFLSLRDPLTLKVTRYLSKGDNQWSAAELSADGKSLIAHKRPWERTRINLLTGARRLCPCQRSPGAPRRTIFPMGRLSSAMRITGSLPARAKKRAASSSSGRQ